MSAPLKRHIAVSTIQPAPGPLRPGAHQGLACRHALPLIKSARCSIPRLSASTRDSADFFIPSSMSPFDLMDRHMRMMDHQMRVMSEEMTSMQRQMDRDMEGMLKEARRAEAQALGQARGAASTAQRQRQKDTTATVSTPSPNVRIERRAEHGSGSYRYYESIQVHSGPGYYYHHHHQAAGGLGALGASPLLMAGALLALAWAAVAAWFAKNFHFTTYKSSSRVALALGWPLLSLISSRFRTQLTAALRGRRFTKEKAEQEQQQAKQGKWVADEDSNV